MQHLVPRSRTLFPLLAAVILVLLALGIIGSLSAVAAPPTQAPVPETPPSARLGQALYQQNCAPCHGASGLGDGPAIAQFTSAAAALADPVIARAASPAAWFQVVKEGRMDRFMPPWKNRMTDQEIWDAVAYAFTLSTSEAELDQGQTVWAENCAACHGDTGAGDGAQAVAAGLAMADLSSVSAVEDASLDDWYQVAAGGRGAMPAFGDQLDEAEIWAALAYARSLAFQPLTAAAVPTGDGRIAGTVVNGTQGASPVAGVPLTLRSFQHMNELQSQEGVSGPDGSFLFEDLPTAPDYFYFVEADYNAVPFSSDLIAFPEGEQEQNATVEVWESSTTAGDISIEIGRWFVEPRDGALLVVEVYRINHQSDQVYVGSEEVAPGKRAVLSFPVPTEIVSLEIDGGEIGDRFVLTGDAVVDTDPLPPGQTQFLMQYLLPFSGSSAEVAHAMPYPVAEFGALVPEGTRVRADGLREMGLQELADRRFAEYGATDLPAGEPVGITLRGLERTGSVAASTSNIVLAYHRPLLYAFAALALGAMLALLAVPFLLRRQGDRADDTAAADALEAQRQQLLEAIADLDDQYAGEPDDPAYQQQRQSLKRRLVAVTQQMRAGDLPPATGQEVA